MSRLATGIKVPDKKDAPKKPANKNQILKDIGLLQAEIKMLEANGAGQKVNEENIKIAQDKIYKLQEEYDGKKREKDVKEKILDKMSEDEIKKELENQQAPIVRQNVSLADALPPARRVIQKLRTKLRNKYDYVRNPSKRIRLPQNAVHREGFSYYGLGQPFPNATSFHQAMTQGEPICWERDEVTKAEDSDNYNNWRARTQWDSRRLVRFLTTNVIFPDDLI